MAVAVSNLRKERSEENSPLTVSWPARRRPTTPVRRSPSGASLGSSEVLASLSTASPGLTEARLAMMSSTAETRPRGGAGVWLNLSATPSRAEMIWASWG